MHLEPMSIIGDTVMQFIVFHRFKQLCEQPQRITDTPAGGKFTRKKLTMRFS